ncbi:MAG: hypothetical protein ACR2LI_16275 [Propionibacteriaceae bacterium]
MSLHQVRAIADAVLYEGYLLYPYRATSRKNQVRWQFGVLGPPGAASQGYGEDASLRTQCLLAVGRADHAEVEVHLRLLQLQTRSVERATDGAFTPAAELWVDGACHFGWDEAVEQEVTVPAYGLVGELTHPVSIPGGVENELIKAADGTVAGRLVRRRWPLHAEVRVETLTLDPYLRLTVTVDNTSRVVITDQDAALRCSLIGTHLLLQAHGARFVSVIDPPADAVAAAAECRQQRCWPVLAGPAGSDDVVLAAPIILYDHPEIAAESAGALFDGTEIDEILTLRVRSLTEDEKAEARATDPRAAEIIDRCDRLTEADLQQLHGVLRNPHASGSPGTDDPMAWLDTGDRPWWDPAADENVQPDVDAVLIDGVRVAKDSLVRLHPSRRADAQDLFFADQVARVTAVLSDVDGAVHVAVVIVDDPAADLHEWYGRYLYFAPDELEPLPRATGVPQGAQPGKES